MNLRFLLQSNLASEEEQKPFIAALDAVRASHGVTWSYVKLIPFAGTVEPEQDYGPCVFPIGSTSMLTASRIYGWTPGVVYRDETFRFEAWRDGWGANNLVNGDGEVTFFGKAKAASLTAKVFIRPCQDLKAFTGHVIDGGNLLEWQERVHAGEQSTRTLQLEMSTPVVVAAPKTIFREWRLWVVADKIVAASQYGVHGRREPSPGAPLDVRVFAERMVDRWVPEKAFVLDIAETASGLGVMEVNTLNSSGIYAASMAPVYRALAELYGA